MNKSGHDWRGGGYHIGIDVGGTFTDLVLANMNDRSLDYLKVPSVPSDPSAAVINGVRQFISLHKFRPSDIRLIVHGTTLGLNAILQRAGAKTGLVVSKGFRGILEIGRGKMPNPLNMCAIKERPLVTRDLVFELSSRIDVGGNVILSPSGQEYDALCEQLAKLHISSLAITLMHSYRFPDIEDEAAAEIGKRLPNLRLSTSSGIWPEAREYERALAAVMNSYIHPLMEEYYDRLEKKLLEDNVAAPIYVTTSNGGSISIEAARRRPIDTILSGPASGVVAAYVVASQREYQRVVTFDMGGTSSDISVSRTGGPEYTTKAAIGDLPVIIPAVNVTAIGAGGGSIVWIDEEGVLKVGPLSAGADPGPVCYGRGGTQPTLTDCYLVVGCLDSHSFLGGEMILNKEAAHAALKELGARIGMQGESGAEQTADAAIQVATVMMATELTKYMSGLGEDCRSFTLMPFGGAGPVNANLLARELEMNSVLMPSSPGTFCALGALLADVKRDFVRTVRMRFRPGSNVDSALLVVLADLEMEAQAWVDEEGELVGDRTLSIHFDMKYVGQAFEMTVPVPEHVRLDSDMKMVWELYHSEHEKLYGFRDEAADLEIVTVRMHVAARMPSIHLPERQQTELRGSAKYRKIFSDNAWRSTAIYSKDELVSGQVLEGPAIIEQRNSTGWILAGWSGTIDRFGNVFVSPTGPQTAVAN
jgi:N-methylhydantoinase A